MSSFSDPPRLPVIDLALFELGEPWRDHVAAQVDWAASEFGFFYVVGRTYQGRSSSMLGICWNGSPPVVTGQPCIG